MQKSVKWTQGSRLRLITRRPETSNSTTDLHRSQGNSSRTFTITEIDFEGEFPFLREGGISHSTSGRANNKWTEDSTNGAGHKCSCFHNLYSDQG